MNANRGNLPGLENFMRTLCLALAAPLAFLMSSTAQAGPGDLLIAPTRVVLTSNRGTEVILNNIGTETATYRISLEIRRMDADGSIDLIEPGKTSEAEKQTLSMISYAPRRVTLPPNQPQSVRIGVRPPVGLADGEYRVHMLFRAIPDAKPVTATPSTGVSVQLTPIYGVTIPIIVRRGALQATAAMSDVKIAQTKEGPQLSLKLARSGSRSTYGNIRVLKAGQARPVMEVVGIGVYPEINARSVELDIAPELLAQMKGPVTVQYIEEPDVGGKVLAEVKTVL
jgi:P pilus assembly chaperone PapD